MQAHTHTQTHTYTDTQARVHTHRDTRTDTDTQIHRHARAHAHAHTHVHKPLAPEKQTENTAGSLVGCSVQLPSEAHKPSNRTSYLHDVVNTETQTQCSPKSAHCINKSTFEIFFLTKLSRKCRSSQPISSKLSPAPPLSLAVEPRPPLNLQQYYLSFLKAGLT